MFMLCNDNNKPHLFINLNLSDERCIDKVLSFLKQTEKPISFDTLSFALGVKKFHLAILLSRLEKQGYVKRAYKRTNTYWQAIKNVDNVEIVNNFGMKKRKRGEKNGGQQNITTRTI